MASSVIFAVVEEGTVNQPRKNLLRLLPRSRGRSLEEVRSDSICSRCCGWGPHRGSVFPRCSLRSTHGRVPHRPVQISSVGVLKGKGQTCANSEARLARRPSECVLEGRGGQTVRQRVQVADPATAQCNCALPASQPTSEAHGDGRTNATRDEISGAEHEW